MPPYALSFEEEEERVLVYAGVVGSLRHRLEKQRPPNLLRAENEDWAVNDDPKTRVHQGLMSNWPTAEAAELRAARP